jgi:hypothetical protein
LFDKWLINLIQYFYGCCNSNISSSSSIFLKNHHNFNINECLLKTNQYINSQLLFIYVYLAFKTRWVIWFNAITTRNLKIICRIKNSVYTVIFLFTIFYQNIYILLFISSLFSVFFLRVHYLICINIFMCVCVNELRLYGSLSMISKLKFQHIFDQSYLFICLCFENLYFSCIYENSYRYFVNIFLFYYQSIYCVQIYSKLYAIT